MTKQEEKKNKKVLVIVTIPLIAFLLLFALTDLITLFSAVGLTLDATKSQGKASDRGVDASTGIFRGMGYKAQNPPPTIIEDVPATTTTQVIDSRITGQISGEGIEGGGGAPASTVGLEGTQELERDEVLVFDTFHTPAKGQIITGSIPFEWGNELPLRVEQVLIPTEFNSWFNFDVPKDLRGEGVSFDGRSENELGYSLTIPENVLGTEFTVPVRLIVESEITTLDANTLIEIEIPSGLSSQFSLAEFIRSILASFRVE